MACEICKKDIETREFDGKNLCYECRIKEYPSGNIGNLDFDILDEKSVKYKFSKTEEEIKKEEFYMQNIKNVLKKFDDIFKREEFDSYINTIEKFLKSDMLRVLHNELSDDNIHEFFLNEFRDKIYDLLNKGKIQHAEKLAYLYIEYGKKYYIPVPGLMYEPLIHVKKAEEQWEEVIEFMILSLKDKIERYEEYDWQEDISESIHDLSNIMRNLFSYIRKLRIDNKNLEEYDAYIRNRMNQDIKPPLDKLMLPETPYANRKIIVDIIRDRCKDYIFWEDPYFTGRGFDFLHEGLEENTSIKEIKIIGGFKKVDKKLKDKFKHLQAELSEKGINAEFRILVSDMPHNRFLITKDIVFDIPSIETITRGNYSTLKEIKNKPPFMEWWAKGKDIIKDWNDISDQLKI